jgi:hypothetical protein
MSIGFSNLIQIVHGRKKESKSEPSTTGIRNKKFLRDSRKDSRLSKEPHNKSKMA